MRGLKLKVRTLFCLLLVAGTGLTGFGASTLCLTNETYLFDTKTGTVQSEFNTYNSSSTAPRSRATSSGRLTCPARPARWRGRSSCRRAASSSCASRSRESCSSSDKGRVVYRRPGCLQEFPFSVSAGNVL